MRINNKGITLIEIIVTIAIASLVLALIFNLFFYNYRLFNKSSSLASVQHDVRMAMDYVISELRNVSEISITNDSNLYLYYIDASLLKSKYSSVRLVTFSLYVPSGQNCYVLIKIEGNDENSNNSYILSSKILLTNVSNLTSSEESPVIFYNKTQ